MRLTYIANIRIPTEKAHGIQIIKMGEAFAKSMEVELVVPKRLKPIKTDPFEYYGLTRDFKIKKLPCLDLIPWYKYVGLLGLWIESFTFFFFVFQYIVFKKTDLLYTRDKFFLPFTLFKKNIIFESHTFPKHFFLYSPFLKKLKGIVVITHKLKDLLIEQGIPPNKILVAPDGVDLEKFDIKENQGECRQRLNIPQDKKIILYTGHLYKWKGAQVLAEASQFLPADVEVYFVGGTKEDIKKFKIQNLKSKVQVIGHRPYNEIPYWLKAADILVLPNSGKEEISKHWTSPIKLFEYMAAQRPIVASDLPSIREILDEKKAIFVRPDDVEDLANGINKALEDKDLAERISMQVFQDVQQYTWQKRAENILTHALDRIALVKKNI